MTDSCIPVLEDLAKDMLTNAERSDSSFIVADVVVTSSAKRIREDNDILGEQKAKRLCVSTGVDVEKEQIIESTIKETQNNMSIVTATVSKKPASLFLVEINMRKGELGIGRNDIYKKLRAIDDSLECLVSLHDDIDIDADFVSKRKFQLLIDTARTKQKRFQSVAVYHLIDNMLQNFINVGKSAPQSLNTSELEKVIHCITIQTPKDRWRAIRKVTEFDFDPLYTVLFSHHDKFSENFQIEQWARAKKNAPFDMFDKFVCNPNLVHSVGFLRDYLEQKQRAIKVVEDKNIENNRVQSIFDSSLLLSKDEKESTTVASDEQSGPDELAKTSRVKTGTIECIASILGRSLSFCNENKI
jgi:hypothetical protein